MILQSLYDYYVKMSAKPDTSMPKQGFSREKISFVLEITKEGELTNIIDIRKDNKAIMLNVPAAKGRTSAVLPNNLWDKTSYVLGVAKPAKKGNKDEFCYSIENKHFDAFKIHHQALAEQYGIDELHSICNFLTSWNPEDIEKYNIPVDFLDSNVVFRIQGSLDYLHDYLSLRSLVAELGNPISEETQEKKKTKNKSYSCIITGENGNIALTHPKIKGVRNAQQAGASLISFNASAFESYNKSQNENAPVSHKAAVAYTNALNYLLEWNNRRNVVIGDTNYIFWSEAANEAEDFLYDLFAFQKEEQEFKEDTKTTNTVQSFLQSIKRGENITKSLELFSQEERNTTFYILGLSSNNARLVQRYCQTSTLADLAKYIDKFYDDFAIEKQYDNQENTPRPQTILLETALGHEAKNISPLFPEALMKTILSGYKFPESIYIALLGRIRSEKSKNVVNYIRVGTIKAYLTRNHSHTIGEISMSLDKERKDIAYLLGRLFSLIEKAQKDALGGQVNATVKDKFLSTACTNPNVVFPQLLKNVQNHIKKATYGFKSEKAIQEIMLDIDAFPNILSLQDQGLFFIGYYHQCNENYKKSETQNTENN